MQVNRLKKRMEQLINGNYDYEIPGLEVSEQKIEVELPSGEWQSGEICFGASDARKIQGIVISSNSRVELGRNQFNGSAVSIPYQICTDGMKDGDQVESEIVISSNAGEKIIPVRIRIKDTKIRSSIGPVQNLQDFARLSMKDFREAFQMFNSRQFYRLLEHESRKMEALYRGMSQNPVTYQHLEEFLIASGEKKPVCLEIKKRTRASYCLDHSMKDYLTVLKSGWGYVRMEIEVRGDFLEVDKRVVTSEDFIGSQYQIEYIIHREKLKQGRQFGKILIKNVYQQLEFEIEASADTGLRVLSDTLAKKKSAFLMENFLKLRMHQMDYRTWKAKTCELIDELKQSGCEQRMLQLYEVYLHYLDDDPEKAAGILKNLTEDTETEMDMREEAVTLYLSDALEIRTAKEYDLALKFKAFQKQKPDDFLLLYLWMQKDEEFYEAPNKVMYQLEKQYELGGRSPFLYWEAYQLLDEQEELLRKLSPFMIQVLRFAQRYGILKENLTKRLSYLACHEKEFSESVYKLLCKGYEQYPQTEILEAVCQYIMLGQPMNREYFKWYAMAVEKDIRITRLYEYFIETMDDQYDQVLPQPIRMYFAYHNTLSNAKRAVVYANIIRNKEEDPATYRNYQESMRLFAEEHVRKHHINENYAVIYQEFFRELTDRSLAEALAEVLFTCKITCNDRKIRQVVVSYSSLNKEQVAVLNGRTAYVPVYSEDAQILLEDEKHRRFAATVAYEIKPLMETEELAKQCTGLDVQHPGLWLYNCKESKEKMNVGIRRLNSFQYAADSRAFTNSYRRTVRKKLLDYYIAHAGDDTLDEYLKKIDCMEFARVDKEGMVGILTSRRMYRKAYEIVKKLGYETIRPEVLVKLSSRMILEEEFEEDEFLVEMAEATFRKGKYDQVILEYLEEYFTGSIECMQKVWKRARGFRLDTFSMEERILMISMYVRGRADDDGRILESYMLQKGKPDVILAYLTYLSGQYFLRNQEVEGKIFKYLEKRYELGETIAMICKLALLKYYSTREVLTAQQEQQVRKLLEECTRNGLRFAFYQNLPAHLTQAYQVEDRVFVEEQCKPDDGVMIYYCLHGKDQKEEPVFRCEPMREIYPGIFSKEYLLFYGERLNYYLVWKENREQHKTPIREITHREGKTEGKTKYQLINQMLAAKAVGNEEVYRESVQQYLKKEHFVEKVFRMMD